MGDSKVWSHSLPADARYLPSDENAMQWIAPWKEKKWRWSVYIEACSKISNSFSVIALDIF